MGARGRKRSDRVIDVATNLEHRNFLLNLGVAGQMYAASQGMVPPQGDGQYLENVDVMKNWKKFQRSGVMEYITNSAFWMMSLIRDPDWSDQYAMVLYQAFVSMMVSNLVLLKDAGYVQLAHDPVLRVAFWDEETESYKEEDPAKYSYWDQISHLDFEPGMDTP